MGRIASYSNGSFDVRNAVVSQNTDPLDTHLHSHSHMVPTVVLPCNWVTARMQNEIAVQTYNKTQQEKA